MRDRNAREQIAAEVELFDDRAGEDVEQEICAECGRPGRRGVGADAIGR